MRNGGKEFLPRNPMGSVSPCGLRTLPQLLAACPEGQGANRKKNHKAFSRAVLSADREENPTSPCTVPYVELTRSGSSPSHSLSGAKDNEIPEDSAQSRFSPGWTGMAWMKGTPSGDNRDLLYRPSQLAKPSEPSPRGGSIIRTSGMRKLRSREDLPKNTQPCPKEAEPRPELGESTFQRGA